MSENDKELFKLILKECNYILKNTPDHSAFIDDETFTGAFIRSLEIIGESTKKISKPTKLKHPKIPWKNMAGMRDRLIHNNIGVN